MAHTKLANPMNTTRRYCGTNLKFKAIHRGQKQRLTWKYRTKHRAWYLHANKDYSLVHFKIMMYCKSNYIPTFYSIIIQIIFHNKNDDTTACIINWEFSQQNEKKRLLILHLVSYLYWNIVWLQNQQKIAIFDRVHDSIRHDTIAYICINGKFSLEIIFLF